MMYGGGQNHTLGTGASNSFLTASGWLTLTSSSAIRTKWPAIDWSIVRHVMVDCHLGTDIPCLSCSSIIRRFWSPINIRTRCHKRVKDARKGPGTSLMVLKYLRHVMIAMIPAKAWAQMYGHVKAAWRDSTRTIAKGNWNVMITAAQVNGDDPTVALEQIAFEWKEEMVAGDGE